MVVQQSMDLPRRRLAVDDAVDIGAGALRKTVIAMQHAISNARAIEAFENPQQNSARAALFFFPERHRPVSLSESQRDLHHLPPSEPNLASPGTSSRNAIQRPRLPTTSVIRTA